MEKVILEVLVFCKRQAIVLNDVLGAVSWRTWEKPTINMRYGLRNTVLAEEIAREAFNAEPGPDWPGGYKATGIWTADRLKREKKNRIPSAMEIIPKLEKWVLLQNKPRDIGIFKSEKSGMINKERIRVPHR